MSLALHLFSRGLRDLLTRQRRAGSGRSSGMGGSSAGPTGEGAIDTAEGEALADGGEETAERELAAAMMGWGAGGCAAAA